MLLCLLCHFCQELKQNVDALVANLPEDDPCIAKFRKVLRVSEERLKAVRPPPWCCVLQRCMFVRLC